MHVPENFSKVQGETLLTTNSPRTVETKTIAAAASCVRCAMAVWSEVFDFKGQTTTKQSASRLVVVVGIQKNEKGAGKYGTKYLM